MGPRRHQRLLLPLDIRQASQDMGAERNCHLPHPHPVPAPPRGGARMSGPYYADDHVTLYHGDCRDLLPDLGRADCVVADPPYGETSLEWDRWPDGWLNYALMITDSLWCFGSLRMFLDRAPEFMHWRLSHDIVWEKHNGSGIARDRFYRVHEHVVHWYSGAWDSTYHETPVTLDATARAVHRRQQPKHTGKIGPSQYATE